MTAPTRWVAGLRIEPCASTGALWLARCACRGAVQDVLLHALQGGLASSTRITVTLIIITIIAVSYTHLTLPTTPYV